MKRYIFSLLLLGVSVAALPEATITIKRPSSTAKLRYCLLCRDKRVQVVNTDEAKELCKLIRFDLEFTDQLSVNRDLTISRPSQIKPSVLAELFSQGVSGCIDLAITQKNKENVITARIYDTAAQEMIDTQTTTWGASLIATAHEVSHRLLSALTGESLALSHLAYCEQRSKNSKVIQIADYTCRQMQQVVSESGVNIIPVWHPTKHGLFYSQFTDTNTRLMVYDLKKGTHQVVSSFPGLNMQPSFSPDGKQVLLCLSTKGNSEIYMYDEVACKDQDARFYTQVTKNGGNNTSPCLRKNGDILFCSDYQGGAPQIYYYCAQDKQTRRLTRGGYCTGLTYCEKTGTIAFARPVKGVFQLFAMQIDETGDTLWLRQLTHDGGNKRAPAWSPGGKYLAFVYTLKDKSGQSTDQIAALNLASSCIRVLTKGPNHKSFPAWS